MKNIKSIIIDDSDLTKFDNKEYDTLLNLIKKTVDKFENNYFIIINNVKYKNFPLSLFICDFTDKIGLTLIDEIIWICESETNNSFRNIFKSILWFSKNKEYEFNKDILRVKHIWKDVEWGKREGNYHPMGKDPGNVWIKEYSENAVITEHKFLNTEEIYSKLLLSQISKSMEYFEIFSNAKVSKQNIIDFIKAKTKFEINIKLIKY